ncbi:septation protein A [Sandaracinobacteroides saxicola]|uniref:Inner membrane-spanning protein YciB n=1 Tax=Sandaracinobacteroides saxicola TaxID=2759707 RepID=A0A7G5IF18_9SPHN|nr:septation protein A [Sandaracinobacteroides saxicola]QMW21960.1 septation protein A [Sandaracinobacteroides saxicola]
MSEKAELQGVSKLLVDFGPMLVFFGAYQVMKRAYGMADTQATVWATGIFMVAVAISMVFAYVRIRRIPAMLWFTAALVGIFGGLTIWLQDDTFIKMKPTILYALFGAILFFGLWRGTNYLKLLLGKAFEGLSDEGWNGLTRRWAIFFVAMAVLNEVIWRSFSTDIWFHFKTWGDVALTFVFALAMSPYMMKHGVKWE